MSLGDRIRNFLGDDPKKLVDEILKSMKEEYGEIPFIAKSMSSQRPEAFIFNALQTLFILKRPKAVPQKTAELLAIAAATAIGCEHCVDFHIRAAIRLGVSKDEIFDAIMVAGLISQTSKLAVGLRKLERSSLSDSH
ncbi:MAG: carboxymuconolactone decarboxylase family protein [Candidatus Freyarchaeota archaeon]|nr:carboxymuconolactone decarboxylase family protein [Candidatus Jordarchaeia archaeon]MBS7268211.1 carboxymuconolactone decarboxylase family protein [Candidatus Jordarchaeia archaeon]